jgi:hypothetical protein
MNKYKVISIQHNVEPNLIIITKNTRYFNHIQKIDGKDKIVSSSEKI